MTLLFNANELREIHSLRCTLEIEYTFVGISFDLPGDPFNSV